jgi:hypothetical protein
MNRAERRRTGKKGHEPVINIKTSDINQIKENAIMEASNKAFFLMLAIPVMVIHDKYPQLMRKEVDGKSREERFVELCIDLYDSFDRGYITLEDFHQCLWEEAGIKIERS